MDTVRLRLAFRKQSDHQKNNKVRAQTLKLETTQTIAGIGATGFASRRATTWTLSERYEISSILADGTYGDPRFGVKTKGNGFRVSRDADGKAKRWFAVTGDSGKISEIGMRVIGANGEQIASIKPAIRGSENRNLFQVTEPSGEQVMALGLVNGEIVDLSERVVRAGGRDVGRFWQLDVDCCALKLAGLPSVDPRIAIAFLLFLHKYRHGYVGIGGELLGEILSPY